MKTEQPTPNFRSRAPRTVLAAQAPLADALHDPETHSYMKRAPRIQPEQEPVGIVISRGTRHEDVPTVWAYVWGPAPEPGEAPIETV